MISPTMHGFDVSHWNPTVAVNREELIPDYPLMSCKATEGQSFRDPAMAGMWEMFKRNGAVYRTAFHWIRSDSPVANQVDNFLLAMRAVGAYSPGAGLEVGVFLQLDWETTPRIPPVGVVAVEDFCRRIYDLVGPRLVVYGSDWVPGFTTWRQRNPDAPLWYANYNLGVGPTGGAAECAKYRAAIWQWTDAFPVPGFVRPVDGNMILDFAVVANAAGYEGLVDEAASSDPAPSPVLPAPPIPTPTPVTTDSIFLPFGGDVLKAIGIYRVNGEPVLMAKLYDGGYKVAVFGDTALQEVAAAQNLSQLDGRDVSNHVIVDDPIMWRALGPVAGPRPDGFDAYGLPV